MQAEFYSCNWSKVELNLNAQREGSHLYSPFYNNHKHSYEPVLLAVTDPPFINVRDGGQSSLYSVQRHITKFIKR